MADSKDVKKLMGKLRSSIDSGIELFKKYKTISKIYVNTQSDIKKNFNTNKFEKTIKNINNKLDKIHKRKESIVNRKVRKTLTESESKLSNLLNEELANEEKKLIAKRNQYKKNSESTLVEFEKTFLKEKQKINYFKNKILSNILKIGEQIRSLIGIKAFKEFVNQIQKRRYKVLDGKTISFKTLMHHLDSAKISEEVSKTTKKIDELMTSGNVINRKKKMEIGIKKKELEKSLKGYDNVLESLKKIAATKFPNREITNNDINLLKKYNEDNSVEYKKRINELGTKLKELKYEVKTKRRELQELESSS
jgi:hypothetical protein